MSILSDREIKRLSVEQKMIEPFVDKQVRDNCISYGLSSYGYDFRISDEFHVFHEEKIVDPKNVKMENFKVVKEPAHLLKPGHTVLAKTVEYFRIPRDILTICFGKSTYARCGILINVTPFEPEWEGFATISITNTSQVPVRIYANEGIAQLIFLRADTICETSYKDKKGKYQAQQSVTYAKV
jgi:dCTP deaminase